MSPTDSSQVKQYGKHEQHNSLCLGTFDYMWLSKRPHFIIGLLLFVISIILIIILVALQLSVIYSYNYAIVIDAGSTGTRAFLYEWKDERGVINDAVREKTFCKTGKLQNVSNNLTNNGLLDCITTISKHIPSSYILKPSIYLAATAGMRLFEIENPVKTKQIFERIADLFKKKDWNSKFIGIITGQTEAISAWITANYLKKTIGKNKPKRSMQTIGALDLGGASTQIALETSESNVNVNLYNERFSLYAISYLCYGVNMFLVRYLSSVSINKKENEFNCLLKGSSLIPTDDSVTCRVNGSKSVDFNSVKKKIEPDSIKCRTQIRDILISTIPKPLKINNRKFVAVSTFYYYQGFLKKYYNITDTFSSFINATDTFCGEDYSNLPKKYPKSWKYAVNYCFTGNYIITLLQLYGFDEISFKDVEFLDEIQGLGVGWNLGYIIEKTRHIPDVIICRLNKKLFAALVTLSAVFLLFTILLFLFTMWERRQKIENLDP